MLSSFHLSYLRISLFIKKIPIYSQKSGSFQEQKIIMRFLF
ncbi:hypothetical protein pb186bvf_002803 [Paramecium bursaria]